MAIRKKKKKIHFLCLFACVCEHSRLYVYVWALDFLGICCAYAFVFWSSVQWNSRKDVYVYDAILKRIRIGRKLLAATAPRIDLLVYTSRTRMYVMLWGYVVIFHCCWCRFPDPFTYHHRTLNAEVVYDSLLQTNKANFARCDVRNRNCLSNHQWSAYCSSGLGDRCGMVLPDAGIGIVR